MIMSLDKVISPCALTGSLPLPTLNKKSENAGSKIARMFSVNLSFCNLGHKEELARLDSIRTSFVACIIRGKVC